MPSVAVITRLLLAISALGCALTVIKLFTTGLYRKYPVFTGYFLFAAADQVWPVLLSQKSLAYFWLFVVTEPLSRIFFIFAVLEFYRLMLEKHPGLYSLGRWVLYGGSLVSVTVSILLLLPHITPAMTQRSVHLGYIYAFDRGVDFSLTVFVLLALLFISQYPVTLSRNMLAFAGLYSVYFLSNGTYSFVRRVVWKHSAPVPDVIFSGIVAACCVAWFFLLTRKGEEVPGTRLRFSEAYEARLLGKLDSLNQILLKSTKS
jgi:hypothetical protein